MGIGYGYGSRGFNPSFHVWEPEWREAGEKPARRQQGRRRGIFVVV